MWPQTHPFRPSLRWTEARHSRGCALTADAPGQVPPLLPPALAGCRCPWASGCVCSVHPGSPGPHLLQSTKPLVHGWHSEPDNPRSFTLTHAGPSPHPLPRSTLAIVGDIRDAKDATGTSPRVRLTTVSQDLALFLKGCVRRGCRGPGVPAHGPSDTRVPGFRARHLTLSFTCGNPPALRSHDQGGCNHLPFPSPRGEPGLWEAQPTSPRWAGGGTRAHCSPVSLLVPMQRAEARGGMSRGFCVSQVGTRRGAGVLPGPSTPSTLAACITPQGPLPCSPLCHLLASLLHSQGPTGPLQGRDDLLCQASGRVVILHLDRGLGRQVFISLCPK